jgi:hypothetical protein
MTVIPGHESTHHQRIIIIIVTWSSLALDWHGWLTNVIRYNKDNEVLTDTLRNMSSFTIKSGHDIVTQKKNF